MTRRFITHEDDKNDGNAAKIIASISKKIGLMIFIDTGARCDSRVHTDPITYGAVACQIVSYAKTEHALYETLTLFRLVKACWTIPAMMF